MKQATCIALFFLLLTGSLSAQKQAWSNGKSNNIAQPLATSVLNSEDITLDKDLQYKKYTLEDTYKYEKTTRSINWNTIKERIAYIENMESTPAEWGYLSNYKNQNGEAPLVKSFHRNVYKRVVDDYEVERYQSAPLYNLSDTLKPIRYGNDGLPVKILGVEGSFKKIEIPAFNAQYLVPTRYLKTIAETESKIPFDHVVVVDRHQQNVVTLQRKERGNWFVRSINPCTTGRHKPPHAMETPIGIFVLQNKKVKMFYTKDGSHEIQGYAPFASRFTNGAYLHGVPTQDPKAKYSEWSWSLGTIPRSHMCVRLASSHAKYIFDNFPSYRTLVVVIGKNDAK